MLIQHLNFPIVSIFIAPLFSENSADIPGTYESGRGILV